MVCKASLHDPLAMTITLAHKAVSERIESYRVVRHSSRRVAFERRPHRRDPACRHRRSRRVVLCMDATSTRPYAMPALVTACPASESHLRAIWEQVYSLLHPATHECATHYCRHAVAPMWALKATLLEL